MLSKKITEKEKINKKSFKTRKIKALHRRFWRVFVNNHKKLHLKKLQSINIYYEVKYSNLDKMTI